MAGTIASANLKIMTDSGQYSQGLAQADQKLTSWAKKQEKTKEALSQPTAPKGLADQKGGILASMTPSVGGLAALVAIPLTLSGIASGFQAVSERILATDKAARELGVGVESFSALQQAAKVAGVNTDDLQTGILALQKNLMLADGPARQLFGQIGLDPNKLRALTSVDEQMATVADALKSVADPGERARLALAVLGDKAGSIAPLLDKGGAGIRQLAEDARAAGTTVNEVQVAKIREAQEAMAKLNAYWEAFCNWLTIGTASVIKFGESAVSSFKSTANSIADDLLKPLDKVVKEMEEAAKKKPFSQDDFKAMRAPGSQVDPFKAIDAARQQEEAAKARTLGITKANEELLKSITSTEQEMLRAMKTVGMSSGEQKVFDIEQKFRGINPVKLRQLKELADIGKSVDAAWGTIEVPPLQQWERQIEGLTELFNNGRISEEQFQKGLFKAGQQMQQAAGLSEPKTVGIAMQGSSAAVSAEIKASLQSTVNNDPAAEMRRAQAELKAINQAQLDVAQKMLTELQRTEQIEVF